MMYSSVNGQLDCYYSKNYVILIMAGLQTLNFTINKAVHEALKQRVVIQHEASGMELLLFYQF